MLTWMPLDCCENFVMLSLMPTHEFILFLILQMKHLIDFF